MARRVLTVCGVVAIIALMTAVATWPQPLHVASQVAAHNDPNFSIWRLGWIAHALATKPTELFNGNIFYPAPRTLAYSDATLFEGLLAAPLLWMHAPPVVVYNLLLLGGFLTAGIGMFVLVRYLTRSIGAALVAAAVFTMAPYRLEHFMHLELQWTMWMPLALWAVHRAFDSGRWTWGAATGLFLALQVISCVYYGVFLAMMVAALIVMLAVSDWNRARAAAPGFAAGALVALVLIIPYMWPYMENAKLLGPRSSAEIAQYSALPINYLASPPQNWLWGWTADVYGGNETRLFPGLIAVLLAAIAFVRRPPRLVWIYAALCGLAVELSFGTNGWMGDWLYAHVHALQGLRAPARFAILAQCMLAVLSAFGFQAIAARFRPSRTMGIALAAAVVAILVVEYTPTQMFLVNVANNPADVYRVIRSLDEGVVAELPMPHANSLPEWDAIYESWSINHWHPILNGYSGYYPPEYITTIEAMRHFPDAESIARLRVLNVRFIVVHRAFYKPGEYSALLERMLAYPDLRPGGHYSDPVDEAQLFELAR